ncbi:MAG: sulfatase-like hydrolase/transferase [Verrucomicrobiota bacterium]
MTPLRSILAASTVLIAFAPTEKSAAAQPHPDETARFPNMILVFIDDMGWGDFSCFGNTEVKTTNIDRLAAEGIRFNRFYVNSPICSPSRVAISTGQYPTRWGVTSYLASRQLNNERGMTQWLDPEAPMLARFLKNAGYATGHFGKWHMGGQRDVGDAPYISEYGFDESLTNFEGLGPRILAWCYSPNNDPPPKKHFGPAENLPGPTTWVDRSEVTQSFVDAAIPFIDKAAENGTPFYINLWPDDVHTPCYPPLHRWGDGSDRTKYLAVLKTMDEQLGLLFDRIRDDEKLRNNTIILICSDNGPAQNFGSAGPHRGYKTHLYEGGVRSPLIVWAPGIIDSTDAGTVNETSVFSAIDLVPSLLDIAGVPRPETIDFDGEVLSHTIIGKGDASRKAPLFFRRPPDRDAFYGVDDLPDLAVIDGNWKVLCEFDGSNPELYDLDNDPAETNNLADKNPELVQRLTNDLLAWQKSMPQDNGATFKLDKKKRK